MLVPSRQGASGGRGGGLLHERGQIDEPIVAPCPTGAGHGTIHAIQRAQHNQQLHLVEREIWRTAAIVAILPAGDHRSAVLHARKRVRRDATVGKAMAVGLVQIRHELFHVTVAHGIEIAFQRHAAGTEHQNRGFAVVGHAIDPRRDETGVMQSQQHGVMMMDGVDGGTVPAHGHAGQPNPLPQLIEISGDMHLIVEHGYDETVAVGVNGIVDAGVFDEIVIENGLQHARIGTGIETA